MTRAPLLECVPNLSEGRDPAVLAELAAAAAAPGVRVIGPDADPDHHRAVLTLLGTAAALEEAALRLAGCAVARLDLTRHAGVHPRLGALDVLPFVPLAEQHMPIAVDCAHRTGRRLAAELGLPVFFYEEAALRPERRHLAELRRGGFEALRAALDLAPDAGPPRAHPTAGAVAVGARRVLIAFNVNLATNDLALARRIARRLRASNGGLPAVKALGLRLASRGLVQVSMNLTDWRRTGMAGAAAAVAALARAAGAAVHSHELVGLVPRAAAAEALAGTLTIEGFGPARIIEEHLPEEG